MKIDRLNRFVSNKSELRLFEVRWISEFYNIGWREESEIRDQRPEIRDR